MGIRRAAIAAVASILLAPQSLAAESVGPKEVSPDSLWVCVAGWVVASCAASRECSRKPVCDADFTLLRVDPTTMRTEIVVRHAGIAGVFGAPSTALEVGDTLWSGSFRGDRIPVFPLAALRTR